MKKLFVTSLVLLSLGFMSMELCHFPVAGYCIPNALGLERYGPASQYEDNGDGTFTDEDTKITWEIKTDDDSVHDVDNTYTWTAGEDDDAGPDGALFKTFLKALNSTCGGEGVTDCENHKDCAKGEKCGFAGHSDWCIPDIKELQSIVDYRSFRPASSVYGETATTYYWSSTPSVILTNNAWTVNFFDGLVLNSRKKTDSLHARAMRPCK